MKSTQEIKKGNFKEMVLHSPGISLVKCTSSWSGSSQLVALMFRELAKEYQGKINFFTLDVEENKMEVEPFGVRELPHFLFFKSGELVDQVIGTAHKSILENKLKNIILSSEN